MGIIGASYYWVLAVNGESASRWCEDRWVQCGPAPEAPRGFAGAAKCDGMVLVFSRSGHVYAYEPETDSWRSLSAAPPGFFCHEIVVA